jgi:hypothetical protein
MRIQKGPQQYLTYDESKLPDVAAERDVFTEFHNQPPVVKTTCRQPVITSSQTTFFPFPLLRQFPVVTGLQDLLTKILSNVNFCQTGFLWDSSWANKRSNFIYDAVLPG